MPYVEITMKSGAVIIADATDFEFRRNVIPGSPIGSASAKWTKNPNADRVLLHIAPENIEAIVLVDETKKE